jgi:hypothetical protein
VIANILKHLPDHLLGLAHGAAWVLAGSVLFADFLSRGVHWFIFWMPVFFFLWIVLAFASHGLVIYASTR